MIVSVASLPRCLTQACTHAHNSRSIHHFQFRLQFLVQTAVKLCNVQLYSCAKECTCTAIHLGERMFLAHSAFNVGAWFQSSFRCNVIIHSFSHRFTAARINAQVYSCEKESTFLTCPHHQQATCVAVACLWFRVPLWMLIPGDARTCRAGGCPC